MKPDPDIKLLLVSLVLLVVQCSNLYVGYQMIFKLNRDMTLLAVLLVVNVYLLIASVAATRAVIIEKTKIKRSNSRRML